MKELSEITRPISNALKQFDVVFEEEVGAETFPMNTIMHYAMDNKGKRLRPILVLLSSQLFGEVNEQTLRAATFVEMLHTATLIHDDVVDGSSQRRGKASVNAHWDNNSAVLAGDYLLAKAMKLIASPSDSDILNEMLNTTLAMSEGELMQNQMNGEATMQEATYLDIITRKTALLMRSYCVIGALSVNAHTDLINRIADFGLNFGILFQMTDDIIDADNPNEVAMAKALLPTYKQRALEALQGLSPSETLTAFKELVDYCVRRKK